VAVIEVLVVKTSAQTTYILLERGIEDVRLLAEINKITADAGINSIKKLIKEYPMLSQLRDGLRIEVEQ